jgi:hypothetical protein
LSSVACCLSPCQHCLILCLLLLGFPGNFEIQLGIKGSTGEGLPNLDKQAAMAKKKTTKSAPANKQHMALQSWWAPVHDGGKDELPANSPAPVVLTSYLKSWRNGPQRLGFWMPKHAFVMLRVRDLCLEPTKC